MEKVYQADEASKDQAARNFIEDGPLPRFKRQARKKKSERGLAADSDLTQLAREYLKRQRQHWPNLERVGLLPEPDEKTLSAMVADFKHRHQTGEIRPGALEAYPDLLKLAGSYNRYSCDNSEPNSIIDQLSNSLAKARAEERFIPWDYVFADYGVTGLHAGRQGYSSYKQVLADQKQKIETTYVDDFTRASRDEIEWWKLAYLSRRLKKRMIGASDGFDLGSPNWDLLITMYGLVSRLHIKGLREKVVRGMRGAVGRRTCVGKPSLGHTRCLLRDEKGNPVLGADGEPKYRLCIDPASSEHRRLIFDLFVRQAWSAFRIAKHFNQQKVDGSDRWTEAGIKKLLRSPSAIGYFRWNQQRKEFDFEQEKWVVTANPRKEWVVYHDPDLALVPVNLWKAARRRLLSVRRGSGRKQSRNQASATTLFSGTLVCGYCGREITLTRSTDKYKMLGCLNGPTHNQGCKLRCSKSTRIVEECLLKFLQEAFLTETALEDFIARANAFLEEESKRPRVNTQPLKKQLREKEAAIERLFSRIVEGTDESLCKAYDKQIAALQKDVDRLRSELREAEKKNSKPPAPLDKNRIATYLADFRGLLNQEVPAVAEAIRGITGPIEIRQEDHTDGRKRGARWIARFSPKFLGTLRKLGRDKDYPESITLEYLCQRFWITPTKASVRIDKVAPAVQKAAQIDAMAKNGASIAVIAATLRLTPVTVRTILKAYQTGKWPKWKRPGKPTGKGAKPVYKAIAKEVHRLRTSEMLSFPAIAKRLQVSRQTVARAFDFADPSSVTVAAETGRRPSRGAYKTTSITEPAQPTTV